MADAIRIKLSVEGNDPQIVREIDRVAKVVNSRLENALKGTSALLDRLERIGARGVLGSGARVGGGVGGMGTQIDSTIQRLEKLGVRGAAASKVLNDLGNGSQRGNSSLRSFALTLTSVASGLFLIERAGRAALGVVRTLASPLTTTVTNAIEQSDKQRLTAAALSTVSGTNTRARAIVGNLVTASRDTPLTSAEALDLAKQAAFVPQLASRFAYGPAQTSARSFLDYAQTLSKASLLTHDNSPESAGIAYREFLAGQAQSLQRRLNVSPDSVADAIGITLSKALSSPRLAERAFKGYIDQFVGNDALVAQSQTFSNAKKKLGDAVDQLWAVIGQRGPLYDAAVDRLRALADAVLTEASSPDIERKARSIGRSATRIADNLFGGAAAAINRLTGSTEPIDGLTSAITALFTAAEKASAYVPKIADLIAIAGRGAVDVVQRLASLAQHGGSTTIGVAGFDVPVSIGNAREIDRLRKELSFAEEQLVVRRRDEADRLAQVNAGSRSPYITDNRHAISLQLFEESVVKMRKRLADLEGGGDNAFDSALRELIGGKTLGDLARPYERQRQVQELLDRLGSNISPRVAIQSVVAPLSQAANGFEYRSDITQALERANAVPAQIKELFAASGDLVRQEHYSGLVQAARNDLAIARRARSLPVEVSYPFTGARNALDPRGLLNGPSIRTASDLLEQSLGPGKAARFFDSNVDDKLAALKAVEGLPDRLVRGLQSTAGAIADKLDQLPVSIAEDLGGRLKQNVAGLADQVSDSLQLSPDLREKLRRSISDGPGELLRIIDVGTYKAKQRAAELNIPGTLPDSADALLRGGVNTPFGETRALNRLRENRIGELRGRYDRLSGQLNAEPGNTDLATDRAFVGDELKELQRQLADTRWGVEDLQQSFEDMGLSVRDSLTQNVGSAFADIITGTGDASDALRGFARDVIQTFSQLAARNLIGGLLSPLAGKGGDGLLGELFGGFVGAANGAVLPGGFQAFANGSPVVSKPTLGLIGEGRYNEAVIPLPDGRTVPVRMTDERGGDGSGRTFVIVHSEDELFLKGFHRNRDTVLNTITGEIMRPGGRLRKAVRQ